MEAHKDDFVSNPASCLIHLSLNYTVTALLGIALIPYDPIPVASHFYHVIVRLLLFDQPFVIAIDFSSVHLDVFKTIFLCLCPHFE